MLVIHPIEIIHTANTETQSTVGHVPKERFETLSRGIRHAVRPQLAQYENTIGRLEWIIDRHHAVIVGVGLNQSTAEYGKLTDWVCDGSGALLATACRTEVSNSDDTVRLNNQHSRGLTVGHAAHAVDFNRRPILSRQNVLALFRIPTASTNRAAELHEYQRSGFDDGEPFAVVQGYGKLSDRLIDGQSGTVIQPSTQPPLPIVIFADERRAISLPAVCTSTP